MFEFTKIMKELNGSCIYYGIIVNYVALIKSTALIVF